MGAVGANTIDAQAPVNVDSIEDVIRRLRAIDVRTRDVNNLMARSANVIAGEARRLVPVGGGPKSPRDEHPGRLKKSIRVSRAQNKIVVRAGNPITPYAGVQEFGWKKRNIEGSFYLQQAKARKEAEAIKKAEDGLIEILGNNGLAPTS